MAKVLSRLDIILFANTAQYRREIRETGESTKTAMQAMADDAKKMAKVGAAAFASMAAAGVTAVGVMIKDQVELGKEITRTAKIANASVKDIQKPAIAVKAMGVEMDKLGDIYKDTQDKIGDFLTTGGGEMADFFENIAPQIGLTAEEFRRLSGPDALQLYYDSLEQANLSQSELVFYMESVADDASSLIPLLANGGEGFRIWGEAAENAGAVMDEKTIKATQELNASTDLLMLSYDGAKNQFTQAIMPVLSDVAGTLVENGTAADIARKAGELLAKGFKVTAATGVGVVAIVKSIGQALYGVAKAASQFANGVDWSSPFAIFQVGSNFIENNKSAAAVLQQTANDIVKTYTDANVTMDKFLHLGENGTNKTVAAVGELNQAQDQLNKSLGQTGQEYQNQKKQAEDAAKAAEKAAKKTANSKLIYKPVPVNSRVLSQAAQYDYATLEKQYSLPNGILAALSMQESKGNPNVVSPVGAKGAFQFMPKTAERFGIAGKESDIGAAAEAAAKYLNYLMKKFGSVELALAGYNAGEGNVQKYGNKIPPFKETQKYVPSVMSHMAFMQGKEITAGSTSVNVGDMVAEQARAAAEAEKLRYQIQTNYATKTAQINAKRDEEITKIRSASFPEDEEKRLIQIATQRAKHEVEEFEETQQKKIDSLKEYSQTEAELIVRNARYKMNAVIRDEDLTKEQRKEAIIAIAEVAKYDISVNQLRIDQEKQAANEWQQTREDQIKNTYALERRELELTLGMDADLRAAKSQAINQAEQLALDELRYAHEDELRQLGSYGLTQLQSIKADYEQQIRELDRRRDIGDDQKGELRNAITGAQRYALNEHAQTASDAFRQLKSELGGTSENLALAQEYKARLEIVKEFEESHTDQVKEAEELRGQIRLEFERKATQLSLTSSQTIAGNLAESFKTVLGEQNAAYQAMFAAQQVFVMASAGLNMYDAWGDMMATGAGLSDKLAGAATIATEFGRIISAASSMKLELPGFKTGGFTSGGENEVVGFVHGEEFVANAGVTRKYRPELEAMHNGTYERRSVGDVNVNVSVTMDANSSIETNSAYGKQIGQGLAAVVVSEVRKMMRPNGEMDRRYAKR